MRKFFIILLGIILICSITFDVLTAQNDKSFLDPPQLITKPELNDNYHLLQRTSSGISSLAVSHGGRIWAVWYAGITPGVIVEQCANNYIVVSTSDDKGETWKEVLVIDPDGSGPVRAFDPEVWIDPDGQLWIFWAQHIRPVRTTSSGVWAITTTNPESGNPEWSEPRRLTDGVMMCKPIVLSDGEWALPVSY